MSIENHPNFHAAGYTTDIMVAFYDRLRGRADKTKIDGERFKELVMNFVLEVEQLVDESAGAKKDELEVVVGVGVTGLDNILRRAASSRRK